MGFQDSYETEFTHFSWTSATKERTRIPVNRVRQGGLEPDYATCFMFKFGDDFIQNSREWQNVPPPQRGRSPFWIVITFGLASHESQPPFKVVEALPISFSFFPLCKRSLKANHTGQRVAHESDNNKLGSWSASASLHFNESAFPRQKGAFPRQIASKRLLIPAVYSMMLSESLTFSYPKLGVFRNLGEHNSRLGFRPPYPVPQAQNQADSQWISSFHERQTAQILIKGLHNLLECLIWAHTGPHGKCNLNCLTDFITCFRKVQL